jgi:WD40 repeat protein
LLDVETGKSIAELTSNDQRVELLGADWSPDGKRVVTELSDSTARVWDAEIGQAIAVLPMLPTSTRADFSPDGKRIVTTAPLDDARVWNISASTRDLVARMKNLVPRCLIRAERRSAFLDPEPPAWCIEMEKWPYQTQDWRDWLKYKRANASPPLPDTPEWKDWIAARRDK